VTGYTPEDYERDPHLWYTMIHPDDRETVTQQALRVLSGEYPPPLEHRLIHKSGRIIWVRNTSVPRRDLNGCLVGYDSLITNITERKMAEEALCEREVLMTAVLDSLPIGIAVNSVDPAVNFQYMNDSFPKYYRTTKEALARPDAFWNAVYEDQEYREEIKKRVVDDCDSGNPARMYWADVPINRKGEETTFITARNIPIPDKQLMISTVWDVTEHRKLEDRLRQSQKMESIGTLAGGVAHDFNNILTVIIGYGNITLMKMSSDDPNRPNIEQMLQAADRAMHLTQALLLFSRKQPPDRKPVDLNSGIQKLGTFLSRVIGEDIDFKIRLSEGTIPVLMDKHQIGQVLMNLATNARDAMPKGGTFTITTEQVHLDSHTKKSPGILKTMIKKLIGVVINIGKNSTSAPKV